MDGPHSDYDVKFIYVRPLNWYLGIEDSKRDLIDCNDEFDMNGWDLRKALQLLKESNCGILEWLNTELVYRCDLDFVKRAKDLAANEHCRKSLLLAYWGKAGKHYREYINIATANGEVLLKKYLFVIQAILSAKWIITKSPSGIDLPPQLFYTLLHSLSDSKEEVPIAIYEYAMKFMNEKRAGTLKSGSRVVALGANSTVSVTPPKWIAFSNPSVGRCEF